jgi:hypothetical protein
MNGAAAEVLRPPAKNADDTATDPKVIISTIEPLTSPLFLTSWRRARGLEFLGRMVGRTRGEGAICASVSDTAEEALALAYERLRRNLTYSMCKTQEIWPTPT